MDLALQPDRPAWTEVVGVVVACALLLVVLVKLDHAAATRENERARAALAERARETRERAPRQASVPEWLGDRGPITIPLGGAWSPGTAQPEAPDAPVGEPAPGSRGGDLVLFAIAATGAALSAAGALILRRTR